MARDGWMDGSGLQIEVGPEAHTVGVAPGEKMRLWESMAAWGMDQAAWTHSQHSVAKSVVVNLPRWLVLLVCCLLTRAGVDAWFCQGRAPNKDKDDNEVNSPASTGCAGRERGPWNEDDFANLSPPIRG